MLIFELSRKGRRNSSQAPRTAPGLNVIPEGYRRKTRPLLPEVSELDAVRHYTNLSRRNFSIDTHFYPLGSCTMKYNLRAPADMGFNAIHLNLHKTFSTPHGGGGPGAGPVGVAARLLPYLPLPVVVRDGDACRLADETDLPQSVGRLSARAGNAGVLLRAYVYARLLDCEGLQRVGEFAMLNANYLMSELGKAGYEVAFPARRASHEFIVTLRSLKEKTGVTAMDVAKRLLDKGFHAPTTYFPLLVPECLLIEPAETKSKQTLDAFVAAMKEILDEAHCKPELVKSAPHTTPVRRIDEVRAARELDLAWRPHERF